ncbi:POK9 protein, partial [Cisticola juncidis]|nr:POK9 protein [Cisticola juncidis]
GSLGVDITTAEEVTLQDKEVTLIPTDVYGPMYSTIFLVGGLLLGRSSTGKQGIIVIPGVMDADYTGQVKIMAYALQPPVTIPKGSKIAQIIPFENILPHRQFPRQPTEPERGTGNFGSTGHNVFLTVSLEERPRIAVKLQRGDEIIDMSPLPDTGSDISIIN